MKPVTSFDAVQVVSEPSKEKHRRLVAELRSELLETQAALASADWPVIVLFAGVDGAGKGEIANLLSTWLDPRGLRTHAYREPTDEERARPRLWRFWRDLAPRGQIGVYLSAWYHTPLLARVYGSGDEASFERELERVAAFEDTLAKDGALILKFWLHLDKEGQEERLRALSSDPQQSWRVNETDWKHLGMYDGFMDAAEQIVSRTSTSEAPWHIVDGSSMRASSLEVGTTLASAITSKLRREASNGRDSKPVETKPEGVARPKTKPAKSNLLAELDMQRSHPKTTYRAGKQRHQAQLNALQTEASRRGLSTVLVFEGWDAAGKGGAIRRLTGALDARQYRVVSIGPPSDEERQRHYLWRFWRRLPPAGCATIFDRSWYGRVLVERVEGLATEAEWTRAYEEINEFERQLVEHGITLVKFWLHITPETQAERFEAREQTPYKRFKLTEEDLRNRSQWAAYETAVHDMIERTHTDFAPWTLVEANDKRFARIKVLDTVCERLSASLTEQEDG